MPKDNKEKRLILEKELNHGRLAMIAIIAMIVQEYLTGVPIMAAFIEWISRNPNAPMIEDYWDKLSSIFHQSDFVRDYGDDILEEYGADSPF